MADENVPVEQVEVVEEEQPKREYTEEEKKIIDDFYMAMVKKNLHPRVVETYHYMKLTKKTLDEVYHDIANKKSGLSCLNRSFLLSFDRPFIEEVFRDYIKKIPKI